MTTEPKTESKTPTLTALLPDTEMRVLPVKLTDAEVMAKARESIRLGREIDDAERAVDAAKEGAKTTVKEAELHQKELAGQRRRVDLIVHDQAEDRQVRCTKHYDRTTRLCTVRRDDIADETRNVVETRPMSDEEIRRGCTWIPDYHAKTNRLTHPEGDVVETKPLTERELQLALSLKVKVALSEDDWTRINGKPAVKAKIIRPAGIDTDIEWEGQVNGTVTAEVSTAQRDALQRLCNGLEPPVELIEVGASGEEADEKTSRKRGRGRASAGA